MTPLSLQSKTFSLKYIFIEDIELFISQLFVKPILWNMNNTTGPRTPLCPGYSELYSFNTINLTSPINSTWISFQAINGVAAPVTFCINLLIIWVILEQENLRTNKSNILLAALALAELLVSIIFQPILIWMFNCFLRDGCTVSCELLKNVLVLLFYIAMISISTLMMVSIDRYIAVKHPFLYQQITFKNVVKSVPFSWFCVFILIVITYQLRILQDFNFPIGIFLLVLEILVICYCTMYVQITAYRQMKAITAQAVAVLGQATEEQKQEHKRRYQECKKSITICMIMFSSFVLYCPVIVLYIPKGLDFDIKSAITLPISITFVPLQSLVNPLIVSLRLSYIRKQVLRKLAKLFHITNS